MAEATTYSFEVKIATPGYHVYFKITQAHPNEGNEVQVEIKRNKDSIKVDSSACTIRVKGKYFDDMKIVGNILREISQHVLIFFD